jgi:hypothetical protein
MRLDMSLQIPFCREPRITEVTAERLLTSVPLSMDDKVALAGEALLATLALEGLCVLPPVAGQ